MIFLIIVWIVVTIAIIADKDWEHIGGGIAWSMVVTFVLFIVSAAFHHEDTIYEEFKTEIITLDDTNSTSGSFFLGSGSISGSHVYTFYYKTDDGGYKRDYEYSSKSTIYEDENDKPYIQYNKYYMQSNSADSDFWWILFTFHEDGNEGSYHTKDIEFHVPENTIIKEVSLDNRN